MGNSSASNSIDIDVRSDGVYVIINNSHIGPKIGKKEVEKIVSDFGVLDIDFRVLNELFNENELIIKKKISDNTKIIQDPETAIIELSKDRFEAFIKFKPPKNKGPLMTYEKIQNVLQNASISYGIDQNLINQLIIEKEYDRPYLIAVGKKPIDGIDGYQEFHFDNGKKNHKPKLLEDGSVDFRELDLVEKAYAGQLLIKAFPAIEGEDGVNVFGKPIKHKKGKPPQKIPSGKNVFLSEDGLSLLAQVSGQILYAGNRIQVNPLLEISENVDNTTGNIEFNGSVLVNGNVLTGFSIRADGDVDVLGVVEGAKIEAGGNVLISGGVQGRGKAEIYAEGNITIKYADKATLSAKADIIADTIMHSNIKCGGTLYVEGKNGILVGGKIITTNKILAKVIGSSMATLTELEVGQDLEQLQNYKILKTQLDDATSEYNKIEKTLALYVKEKQRSGFSEEKKNALLKSMHTRAFLKEKIDSLQNEIREIMSYLENNNGEVVAAIKMHPGVKATVGNAIIYIRDEILACKLVNIDGKIIIGSC